MAHGGEPQGDLVACKTFDPESNQQPEHGDDWLFICRLSDGHKRSIATRMSPMGFHGSLLVCIDSLYATVGGSVYVVDLRDGQTTEILKNVRAAAVAGRSVSLLQFKNGRWLLGERRLATRGGAST